MGVDMINSYGLYDMAANVREWCGDWYDANYHATSSGINPQGPTSGLLRVARGGGWGIYSSTLRVAHRSKGSAEYRAYSGGFRLVPKSG